MSSTSVPEEAKSIDAGTEVYAGFTLTGNDFDPDEVTRRVGLEPTRTWKAGDLRAPGATIEHELTGWSLRTPREQTWDALRHVAALVEKLRPHIPSIKAVQQALGLEAEFVCVLYIKDEPPDLHFDRAILEVVDALNAEIDVDIYVLREHD